MTLVKPPCIVYTLHRPAPCRVGLKCRDAGVSPVIEAVEPGSIAAAAGLQVGDHIMSVADEPVANGAAVCDMIAGIETGTVVITATAPIGLVSGDSLRRSSLAVGDGRLRPFIVDLKPGTVGASSNLRVGDLILSIDDEEVSSRVDVANRLRSAQGEVVIEVLRASGNICAPRPVAVSLPDAHHSNVQRI